MYQFPTLKTFNWYNVNSLWTSDVIWRHTSGYILAQVMACCLMAPSHEPSNADFSLMGFCGFHLRAIYERVFKLMFCIINLKITLPILRPHFQTLTLKFQLQGQGHGCGQRARSYNRPSIILTHLVFISHQSDQQFLRESYFEIWPWNIQGQDHEWGQRSRSHIVLSIQPMHFLFVSHQTDQPFLKYGQNSVWPWKNTSKIFKENLPK